MLGDWNSGTHGMMPTAQKFITADTQTKISSPCSYGASKNCKLSKTEPDKVLVIQHFPFLKRYDFPHMHRSVADVYILGINI